VQIYVYNYIFFKLYSFQENPTIDTEDTSDRL